MVDFQQSNGMGTIKRSRARTAKDWISEVSFPKKYLDYAEDIIVGRPSPLRDYDQIVMRAGDTLTQMFYMADYIRGKNVVFLGDGDSMSLMFGRFAKEGVIQGPQHMIVLDFDERILEFIRDFAQEHSFGDVVETHLYNVVDPVPSQLEGWADWFYTNPPYGSKNNGMSAIIFISRAIELSKEIGSYGCIILPYHDQIWTKEVTQSVQGFLTRTGYALFEVIQQMHTYRLDDYPSLTSSTVLVERIRKVAQEYEEKPIPSVKLRKFYGDAVEKIPHYIRVVGGEEEYAPPIYTRNTRKP